MMNKNAVTHTFITLGKNSLENLASRRFPALHLPDLISLIAIAVLMIFLGWLGHNSWHFFNNLDQPITEIQAAPVPPAVPVPTLAPERITRLFGVYPASAVTPAASHLLLMASLVGADPSLSRALIQSPAGSQFYSLGQMLPGGGHLHSIQTDQVVIQLLGKSHPLLLQPSSSSLLVPLVPPGVVEVARTAHFPLR